MKNLLVGLCLSLLASLIHADDPLNNLTTLAESGDADAQYQLAMRYKTGEPAARDAGKAAEWFAKAADLGNAGAMLEMSYIYASGKEVPKDTCRSFHYTKRAAELGDAKAQYLLGLKYQSPTSSCGGVDSIASRVWLEKAAGQGYAQAASVLGEDYFLGSDGFVKDHDKALHWLHQALAEQSLRTDPDKHFFVVDSAVYLGLIYTQGNHRTYAQSNDGVADNRLNAGKWFYIAYKLYQEGGCMDNTKGSCSYTTFFDKALANMDTIIQAADPHDADLIALEAFWQDFQQQRDGGS